MFRKPEPQTGRHALEADIKLSPKDERWAQQIHQASIERMMPRWVADLSPAGVQESIADSLKHARMWVFKYGAQTDYLARIYSRLKKVYGEEFARVVFEIEVQTVTRDELTNLAIQLQNMLQKGTTKDQIQQVLEPFIHRNSKHVEEQIRANQKIVENAKKEMEASKAREKLANEKAQILAQELARLQAQLAVENTEAIPSSSQPLQNEIVPTTFMTVSNALTRDPSLKRKHSDSEKSFDSSTNNTATPSSKKKL